jgi:hypothetical protein
LHIIARFPLRASTLRSYAGTDIELSKHAENLEKNLILFIGIKVSAHVNVFELSD